MSALMIALKEKTIFDWRGPRTSGDKLKQKRGKERECVWNRNKSTNHKFSITNDCAAEALRRHEILSIFNSLICIHSQRVKSDHQAVFQLKFNEMSH